MIERRTSRTKLRTLLKAHGLSWKKCRKVLRKADPEKRQADNFSHGQCLIWNEGSCNSDHTLAFLDKVAEWLGQPEQPILIIWDGAPWHGAIRVRDRAEELGFQLMPLPRYSPDLNPIEGLWKWRFAPGSRAC